MVIVMDADRVWYFAILFLALIPWIAYCFMITFFTISLLYGRLRLHRQTDPRAILDHLPGVSIVKPLMGVDPYLETNLESHFTLQYPKFELLLCFEDDQDPAVNIAIKLQQRYPNVDCRLFFGGKPGILNPMVYNMTPGYDAAKYDVVWISTSRIKASTDILLDMVGKLQNPSVALVHQIPFTTDQSGLAHSVEKVYFGCSVARYHQAFHVLGISCFTGMSYVIKKQELDRLNGLSWFGRFLAEDFFIAKMLHDKGFRHQVAAVPAQQNVATMSIASYKDRMVRWLRLRLNMMPITAGFLEPLGESIPLGVYAAWSVNYVFGVNPYLWFTVHWCVWCLLDYLQLKGVQNAPLPFSIAEFLIAWLIRESLYVLVYFEAVLNVRRVTWGKRTYTLSNFGQSLRISSNQSSILPI